MFKTRRFWLGLALSMFFLGLFFYKIDLGDLRRAFQSANYLYVVPSVALYFVAVWFRAVRWSYILQPLRRIPARSLYGITLIGYMANNLLPVRLGELVRAYVLRRRAGVSATATLGTIATERLLDGLFLIACVGVVWFFLPLQELIRDLGDRLNIPGTVLLLLLAAPFLLAFVVFLWLVSQPRLMLRLLGVASRFLPARLREKLSSLAGLFVSGLWIVASPRKLLVAFFWGVLVWLAEGAMFYLVSRSFGIQVSAAVLVLALALSNLATSLPSSGGGVGPFDFFTARVLIFFGVKGADATAYTLVLHAALWLPPTIAGLLLLGAENLTLGSVLHQRRDEWEGPGRPPAPGEVPK